MSKPSLFRRYAAREVWTDLFTHLLNIPSCDDIPDLAPYRIKLQEIFLNKMLNEFINDTQILRTMMENK